MFTSGNRLDFVEILPLRRRCLAMTAAAKTTPSLERHSADEVAKQHNELRRRPRSSGASPIEVFGPAGAELGPSLLSQSGRLQHRPAEDFNDASVGQNIAKRPAGGHQRVDWRQAGRQLVAAVVRRETPVRLRGGPTLATYAEVTSASWFVLSEDLGGRAGRGPDTGDQVRRPAFTGLAEIWPANLPITLAGAWLCQSDTAGAVPLRAAAGLDASDRTPSADDGFLLRRRIGRRHSEKRLSVLGYATTSPSCSSSVEGAQRQIDRLGRGGIEHRSDHQHAEERGAGLCRPTSQRDLTCRGAEPAAPDGQTPGFGQLLQRSHYLGGLPCPTYVEEDLGGGEDLPGRSSVRSGPSSSPKALPTARGLGCGRRWSKTVLLCNAETWTLTATLELAIGATQGCSLRLSS
uniref:Uncharacterized protein n=1 Tax=Macrostomum lignano TaxID=282301 RepID=A0A1I8FE71_9PLAT